jgi:hypothetical protein
MISGKNLFLLGRKSVFCSEQPDQHKRALSMFAGNSPGTVETVRHSCSRIGVLTGQLVPNRWEQVVPGSVGTTTRSLSYRRETGCAEPAREAVSE